MWNFLFELLEIKTVLVFVAIFLGIWLYLSTRLPEGFPPGPRPLPVLGNLGILAKNPPQSHQILKALSKEYGPVVGLKMGSYPAIILNEFDAMKECLVNKADAFSARPSFMYVVNEVVTRPVHVGEVGGVIWKSGKVWKERRRFLLSSMRDFGVGKRSIEGKIQEEAIVLGEELMKKAGKPHNIHLLIQQCVSNIIFNVIYGSRFEHTNEGFQTYLQRLDYGFQQGTFTSVLNFIPILRVLPWPKWFQKTMSYIRKNDSWLQQNIAKQEESFDPNDIRHLTDLYLLKEKNEENQRYTFPYFNFGINLEDLIIAGSETSQTALHWLLVIMLNFPDVQAKCQDEIDKVIGSRMAALADRDKMPFMMAVIHESLRFRPPVALGVPHAADRDTTLYGYQIPKGTLVMTNLYSVNRDINYWDKPEEFNPNRWIGPDGKFQKNEAFSVFSIGPRVCLWEILAWGELFLFSTSMLQKFTFQLADPNKPPSLEGMMGVTLSPENFELIAYPR